MCWEILELKLILTVNIDGCQGLVPSLQVSVAMLYCSIVMALLAQGLLQSVPSFQVSAWDNAIIQYFNDFNRIH